MCALDAERHWASSRCLLATANSFMNHLQRRWLCGGVGEATSCGCSIPYESQTLQFQSSFHANMPVKAVEDGPTPWASSPMWETQQEFKADTGLAASHRK